MSDFSWCYSDDIQNANVKVTGEDFTEINFVGMVNNYCQKTRRTHDYVFEKRCGPPHSPQ